MKNENRCKPHDYGYQRIYNHVIDLFGHDREKANKWWMAPNPYLEDKAPYQLVKEGRGKELNKIIWKCL